MQFRFLGADAPKFLLFVDEETRQPIFMAGMVYCGERRIFYKSATVPNGNEQLITGLNFRIKSVMSFIETIIHYYWFNWASARKKAGGLLYLWR
ncbi:hypothetical protein P9G84_10155 [Brevibacillus centrosporus]|uniref:hypothetical protein n=1 Tax=Brevibacillus centrosporus TaxID=54910 RepID=UPI001144F55C|nr:hypothetical protein [Brevibacillus centrosporus]MEC2129330.1 hypothetical protein [Brevibacillus centrosporus]GED33496.1 hypothetical protein BCE02nite_46370 [Brevibacillus centrosporus]